MPTIRRSGPGRFALSIALVTAAAALSWPLRPLQDISTPLLVLAVLISAWHGGPGPATLAAILSVLAVDFLFVPPYYHIEFNLAFFERSVAFGLVLAVVIWFARARRAAEVELREQTERLIAQTKILERTQEELRRADRMKDQFLAVLSHELRTPLGAIRNGMYLLKHAKAEDTPRLHEMMDRQLMQLLRLLEDLLDVSRITSGKITLRKEHVELKNLVQDAIDSTRPSIEASGHSLDVALPAEPVTLVGDRVRLAQVLSNVLNNSAKFTPAPGRIDLSASKENGEVVVRIRDNGVGIPREMLPQVFEMFAQADRATSLPDSGLGIGLNLVRGLVEAHGGRVEALSDGPGRGSEIVVRLPAREFVPEEALSENR